MASPLLDFKKFTHVKSDDKSTTLKHKDGHVLTLAHNTLSKPNQEQLKALSKVGPQDATNTQREEANSDYGKVTGDQTAKTPGYGKVIMKAEGGPVQENPKLEESKKVPPEAKYCMHCGGPIEHYDTGGDVEKEGPIEAGVHNVGNAIKSGADWLKNHTNFINNDTGALNFGSQPQQDATPAPASSPLQDAPANAQGVPASLQPNAPGPDEAAAQQSVPQTAPKPTESVPSSAPQASAPKVDPNAQPVTTLQGPTEKPYGPMKTPDQVKSSLLQDVMDHNEDYANGQIKPETYNSYFADKSLPSKLGTLFGLALSGFGSGLTHQPNIALEMMNKELDRDFEAQKKSKDNVHNFLQLGLQQKMNDADIENKRKQGLLTDQQAALVHQQSRLEGFAAGQLMHNQAAFHQLNELANSIPPNAPKYQEAQQMLAMAGQGMDAKNANIADMAASRVALLNSGQAAGNDPEAVFAKQQNMYRLSGQGAIADANEQHHMSVPGMPELANQRTNRPVESKDREKIKDMTVLDNKAKDVLGFIKQHSGTWNPQTRAQAEQKIEEMKTFYNNSTNGGALTESRLGWYDQQFAKHPTDLLQQWMGSTKKLEEVADSNRTRRDTELKSYGLKPSSQSAAPAGKYKEGDVGVQKSTGKPIIFSGGAWKYK